MHSNILTVSNRTVGAKYMSIRLGEFVERRMMTLGNEETSDCALRVVVVIKSNNEQKLN